MLLPRSCNLTYTARHWQWWLGKLCAQWNVIRWRCQHKFSNKPERFGYTLNSFWISWASLIHDHVPSEYSIWHELFDSSRLRVEREMLLPRSCNSTYTAWHWQWLLGKICEQWNVIRWRYQHKFSNKPERFRYTLNSFWISWVSLHQRSCSLRIFNLAWAVWHIAPSCWKKDVSAHAIQAKRNS